jgi:hypothetical protein
MIAHSRQHTALRKRHIVAALCHLLILSLASDVPSGDASPARQRTARAFADGGPCAIEPLNRACLAASGYRTDQLPPELCRAIAAPAFGAAANGAASTAAADESAADLEVGELPWLEARPPPKGCVAVHVTLAAHELSFGVGLSPNAEAWGAAAVTGVAPGSAAARAGKRRRTSETSSSGDFLPRLQRAAEASASAPRVRSAAFDRPLPPSEVATADADGSAAESADAGAEAAADFAVASAGVTGIAARPAPSAAAAGPSQIIRPSHRRPSPRPALRGCSKLPPQARLRSGGLGGSKVPAAQPSPTRRARTSLETCPTCSTRCTGPDGASDRTKTRGAGGKH